MATFQHWIQYTFDLKDRDPSRVDDDSCSPNELLTCCLRFFHEADDVLRQVPYESAKRALWSFPGIDGYLGILALPELPFQARAELADAHFVLFQSSFPNRFPDEAFMWWEHLPGAEYFSPGTPRGGPVVGNDIEICLHLWQAIEKILYLPSESCQLSALHGLNELQPSVRTGYAEIIDRFLASPIHRTEKVIKYAHEVKAGQAQ